MVAAAIRSGAYALLFLSAASLGGCLTAAIGDAPAVRAEAPTPVPERPAQTAEQLRLDAKCNGNTACEIREIRRADTEKRCAQLGGVKIGMTGEQIRKSCWGEPRSVNTTMTARGRHEQWVYGGGYLYLDDGVLTSIQTSR